jgi:hypothetical protein
VSVAALLAGRVAAETPADRLKMAWEEYGYQAWSRAERLFGDVRRSPASTAEQRRQAQLGEAFMAQYRMPGRDPAAAVALYEALIRELPATNDLRVVALTQIGSCHLETTPPDFARGRAALRQALDLPARDALVGHEAALRLLASYVRRPGEADVREGLAAADGLLARLEGSPVAGVAHGIASQLAFRAGDLRLFERELMAQDRAGIVNRSIKARVLFQIARLNETEFRDYAKAARYYRRLHDEVPSSETAYYAGLRAAELERGQLDSAYAPPLSSTNLPAAATASEAQP